MNCATVTVEVDGQKLVLEARDIEIGRDYVDSHTAYIKASGWIDENASTRTPKPAPDFYQMAADAFGVTRAEAQRRILEAFTAETENGRLRRQYKAAEEIARIFQVPLHLLGVDTDRIYHNPAARPDMAHIRPECEACFEEEGSYACVRPAHKTRYLGGALESMSNTLAEKLDRQIRGLVRRTPVVRVKQGRAR